ncbi:MAG: DUF6351 family protein, partial [Psychrosphaera sp.]|nr:DUF6351 family protein [Psychrosphaera sp.]
NHINSYPQDHPNLAMINQAWAGVMPQSPKGASECINSWFGLSSLVNNPRMSYLRDYYSKPILKQVHWSYWQDLVSIFGSDSNGFAQTTWDNEGVQYGLRALLDKAITEQEFINLNTQVGAWKSQEKMAAEKFFYLFSRKFPVWLTMWGRHNITQTPGTARPAPRRQASLKAIEQAYRYGQIFIGKVDIPVIDVRHYLEGKLDMHHASASFSSRLRMQQQNRDQNQLIWISHEDFDYTDDAFATLDVWLNNISQNPSRSTADNKPLDAIDKCADASGKVIAQGHTVWDGQWNQKPQGPCSDIYPIYSTSRIQAGESWAASTFKCHLQSVDQAIEKGLYGQRDMSKLQPLLKQIFATGVCDY